MSGSQSDSAQRPNKVPLARRDRLILCTTSTGLRQPKMSDAATLCAVKQQNSLIGSQQGDDGAVGIKPQEPVVRNWQSISPDQYRRSVKGCPRLLTQVSDLSHREPKRTSDVTQDQLPTNILSPARLTLTQASSLCPGRLSTATTCILVNPLLLSPDRALPRLTRNDKR